MLSKPPRQTEKKFNEQNFFRQEKCLFKPVTPPKIETLINCLVTGIDTISPKLIKIAADFLTPLLTVAINKSIMENIFPDSAKIASVIPHD